MGRLTEDADREAALLRGMERSPGESPAQCPVPFPSAEDPSTRTTDEDPNPPQPEEVPRDLFLQTELRGRVSVTAVCFYCE